jgi:hypothetical protein
LIVGNTLFMKRCSAPYQVNVKHSIYHFTFSIDYNYLRMIVAITILLFGGEPNFGSKCNRRHKQHIKQCKTYYLTLYQNIFL